MRVKASKELQGFKAILTRNSVTMSYSSSDTPFSHNNEMEGEVTYQLKKKKKKDIQELRKLNPLH